MHRDSRYISGNVPPTPPYEVGGYNYNVPLGGHYSTGVPAATTFDAVLTGRKYGIPGSHSGIQFQPSETCPKNFFVFGQTENANGIMFHPTVEHKFASSNLHNYAAGGEEYGRSTVPNTDIKQKSSSSFKEDTEDINALLSSEEENDEDDDVVSTGRTPENNWEGYSPNLSCLMEDLGCHTLGDASSHKSTSHRDDRNREGIKKLIEALRSIIPGGDQLDTTAVLDEAVRYLKSLKVEAEKLGIQNLDD
ncbi:hypothetical protein Cni_G00213 [Canna indica]|uniref:BHLH domain-containing protein n=1 Tax=Canna indica TaxID=4628 RepID=A0AAQ3PZZ9_9LILI|nr:hypothetical protein Cni_G00213 [Canna indica]